MKKFLTLLAAFFSLSTTAKAGDVTADELVKILQADSSIVILDIRTPSEYKSGHIKGAINLDFNSRDFAANVSQLDKDKIYVVYCRSGGRSANALPIFNKYQIKTHHLYKGFLSVGGSKLEIVK